MEIVNNGTKSALLATKRLGNLTKEDLYYVRMVHAYSRSRSAPVVATYYMRLQSNDASVLPEFHFHTR